MFITNEELKKGSCLADDWRIKDKQLLSSNHSLNQYLKIQTK